MAISSRDPFPHLPPYELPYAERVPLVHVFTNLVRGLGLRYVKGDGWDTSRPKSLDVLSHTDRLLSVECGVYLGNSLVACSKIARDYSVPIHLYGLDTFSGLPDLSDMDLKLSPENAVYRQNKLFSDTSLDMVQQSIEKEGLSDCITLIPGLFTDTLKLLPSSQDFSFVHIDCDLYEPHLECLEFFYPRMEKGGIIFFDDYHSVEFPMAKEAIDKFMEGRSENLFHLSFGPNQPNFTKTFIVKD